MKIELDYLYDIKQLYETLCNVIHKKKDQLKELQNTFLVVCKNEINSEEFERNAVGDLIVMSKLKSEIKTLELIRFKFLLNRKNLKIDL